MKLFLACLASFALGASLSGFVLMHADDWVHGPEDRRVLTADLTLSFGNQGRLDSCPGAPRGGLVAGTPITLRRHGPFKLVQVTAQLFDKDFPSRPLTDEEAKTFRPLLECATEETRDAGCH